MNLHERCIEALSSGVTYIPGSWDKRFVHRAPPVEHMTPAQLYWTVALCYRYRRQITDKDLVSEAAKWLEHNKKPQTTRKTKMKKIREKKSKGPSLQAVLFE